MSPNLTASVKKAKAAAPAPAPAPTPAPVVEEVPVEATVVAPAKETKDAAAAVVDAILGNSDVVEKYNNFGAMSDKLHLIATLTDPSEKDDTTIGGVKYTGGSIIGFRFTTLVDLEIPDFGTTPEFNGKRINNAADTSRTAFVKAGTTFDLTKVETMALLTREEFGMMCMAVKGEEQHPAALQIAFAKFNPSGELTAADLPSVSIALKKPLSLKMFLPHIQVLTYAKAEGGGQFAEGTRTLNPEFAGTKFEPRAIDLAQRKAVRSAGAKKNTSANRDLARKKQAAALQMLLQRTAKRA